MASVAARKTTAGMDGKLHDVAVSFVVSWWRSGFCSLVIGTIGERKRYGWGKH